MTDAEEAELFAGGCAMNGGAVNAGTGVYAL